MLDVRRAVRVLLVDERDCVLLLWHARPNDDPHWAPPGGGVEPGEDLPTAARRELREEVGLVDHVALEGPVWEWQHRFRYHGTPIDQHETIYLARVGAIVVAGDSQHLVADGIVTARWWSVAELAHCPDDVWPHGLADRLPVLLRAG